MRLVILESPYAGDIDANVEYGRRCLRDCLLRGEAPIASHLLYTQPGVLDDTVPVERRHGIEAGLAWGTVAEATVVYTDLGISSGMQHGIDVAAADGAICVALIVLSVAHQVYRDARDWERKGEAVTALRPTPFTEVVTRLVWVWIGPVVLVTHLWRSHAMRLDDGLAFLALFAIGSGSYFNSVIRRPPRRRQEAGRMAENQT